MPKVAGRKGQAGLSWALVCHHLTTHQQLCACLQQACKPLTSRQFLCTGSRLPTKQALNMVLSST
jgi:hypothetical protein